MRLPRVRQDLYRRWMQNLQASWHRGPYMRRWWVRRVLYRRWVGGLLAGFRRGAVWVVVVGEAGPVSSMGGSSAGGVVSGAEPTGGLFPVDDRRLASSPSLLFPSSEPCICSASLGGGTGVMSANHTAAGMSTILRTTGIVAAPSSSPSPLPIPVPYPPLVSASASGPAFVLVRRTGGEARRSRARGGRRVSMDPESWNGFGPYLE